MPFLRDAPSSIVHPINHQMMATIVVDDDHRTDDSGFISGCWGTIAEQTDETYYDDRLDADDDLAKGRIRFPTAKLYGRDGELEMLSGLCGEILLEEEDNNRGVRVVFVGGYSGVGKSAVVAQLVQQVKEEHGHQGGCTNTTTTNIVCASGKYSKLHSAAAPFSAISELLGQLTAELINTSSDNNHHDEELLINIRNKLSKSSDDDDDGSDMEQIMRSVFPSIAPLFEPTDEKSHKDEVVSASVVAPNMNEIKVAFKDCMKCIFSCLDCFIFFLDDCQWSDDASLLLLNNFLLSSSSSSSNVEDEEFGNVLFIGSYRSNEVDEGHSFHKLMEDVEKCNGAATVTHIDLFGLSPDDVGEFLSDTLGKDGAAEVSTLTEVIYATTLGNIFFVKQALEELVRKNAVFYDVMMFTWEYNVTRVQLENHLSDDVIEMVQSKIEGLPQVIKMLVVIMSFLPNNTHLSTMMALLECEGVDSSRVENLMKYAVKQGMIIYKKEADKYAFAHDKIREASFNMIPKGRDRDELLVRLSNVLIDLTNNNSNGSANTNEWALFVAVDHMNSVLPELIPRIELSRLNYRVGKLNLAQRATFGDNENFLSALACLNDSKSKWKDKEYQFTLLVLNEVIMSEFSVGHFEMAFSHVQDVLENALSLEDKFTAHLYRMKALAEGENRDYKIGVAEGLKICDLYGYKFSNPPKKSDLMKASVQLKAALRNRPLTVLGDLPLANDTAIFQLLQEVLVYASFSGNRDLVTLISDRAIYLALQKGLSQELMSILTLRATNLAKDLSKLKTANKVAVAAEKISEIFRDENKVAYKQAQLILMSTVFALLRPFRECLDTALDAHRPLLNAGKTSLGLAAGMSYVYMYLNAGLPLNSPLLGPKLILFGEASSRLQMSTFKVTFDATRQMLLNLRKQTKGSTELKGDVFDEDAFLRTFDGPARTMSLRDTSAMRLFLSFIFWDEECMIQMLENLSKFTDPDMSVPRTFLRLCFIGLAGFEMGRKNKDKSHLELGNKCLDYFKSLSKLGSSNAIPIYQFMKATASPSRAGYDKAISQCKEGRLVHLAAMASERCGVFLGAGNNGDHASKEYIVAAYWLYNDWGASSKVNNMLETWTFLKEATQNYHKASSDSSSNMRLANRVGKN